MTYKTPLDTVLESFTFKSVGRDVLEENLSENASISELKNEYMYYSHQASHGPEKSRHVMAQKAEQIKDKIKQLETVDEDLEKKVPLQVSEEELNKEKSLEEEALSNFLKNVIKK
jgi:hypothetical protein